MECRICEYSADGKCLYYGGEHGDHCHSCSKYQKQSYEIDISYSARKGKAEMVTVCLGVAGKKLRSSNLRVEDILSGKLKECKLSNGEIYILTPRDLYKIRDKIFKERGERYGCPKKKHRKKNALRLVLCYNGNNNYKRRVYYGEHKGKRVSGERF